MDCSIATLNFDNAIEMFLYALIDHLGIKVDGDGFVTLIKALKKMTSRKDETVPFDEVEIRNIHYARNNVQHHGIAPNIGEIEKFGAATYELLSYLSEEFLGMKFEQILLSELIRDDFTRNIYRRAEETYSLKDYENALLCAALAFEHAKKLEQGRIWGSGLLFAVIARGDKLGNVENILIDEVEVLKLRLDYKKYQKYRDIFGRSLEPFTLLEGDTFEELLKEMKVEVNESVSAWHKKETEDLKIDALFCLSFVLDSILGWEAVSRKGWRDKVFTNSEDKPSDAKIEALD